MLSGPVIIVVALLYIGVLFALAYYGDKRADARRSLIANPYIYSLSIAVYCTAWTFYGSVGRAAASGVGFLPIYLGPTLAFVLATVVIRKIVRISKVNRTTSIADFIASRYGKSFELGALVTVIAVVGILPYISLQLKAISTSFSVLLNYPEIVMPGGSSHTVLLHDTALYVALIMAAFAILFGTRHIDASEHHEGLVAAIAFESVVKLVAFLAVGLFVVYGVFGGLTDIFASAEASGALRKLFTISNVPGYSSWLALTVLAMAAVVVLPRQFQVIVVENVDEQHLFTAMWLFPLYLLLINLFVLPIAFAGLLLLPQGGVDPDTFVLTVPMAERRPLLTLVAFIGGLSAATSMIIVETVALATMVSNDLVMPLLLRIGRLHLSDRRDLSGLLLSVRRVTIILVVLLGYAYVRLIGESYALATIGLVSFVAAMQFVPSIIGGIYWKGATKAGALAGLLGGFATWIYTLLLPSFARSGWIPQAFLDGGIFGSDALKPYELLGLSGLDPITHATIWTMLINAGLFVTVSLSTTQSMIERNQAVLFVDVFKRAASGTRLWLGRATIGDLRQLLTRFVGEARADAALQRYERESAVHLSDTSAADAKIVSYCERQLAGAIGAASARIMIASVLREEMHDIDEVLHILDEASQLVLYSRQLEEKSAALLAATAELRAANEQLKELDKMKDDFVATVSHEVRTPLTSIRSFSEILRDNPDLHRAERQEFLRIIVQESERLTRLINDILDLAKMQAGTTEWRMIEMAPKPVIEEALAAAAGWLATAPNLRIESHTTDDLPLIRADPDRLTQVIMNLVSNAVKFCNRDNGRVRLDARTDNGWLLVEISDNGEGIAPEDHKRIFERFQQAGKTLTDKPKGTGLGLPICRQILNHFGGEITVESAIGRGAKFSVRIPPATALERGAIQPDYSSVN